MATIVIRLIRSFEYRNVKNMVLHNVDIDKVTTEKLLEMINNKIQSDPAYVTHRNKKYDTLKIYSFPQSYKSQNLVINLEDDETRILLNGKTLKQMGIGIEDCYFFINSLQVMKLKSHVLIQMNIFNLKRIQKLNGKLKFHYII